MKRCLDSNNVSGVHVYDNMLAIQLPVADDWEASIHPKLTILCLSNALITVRTAVQANNSSDTPDELATFSNRPLGLEGLLFSLLDTIVDRASDLTLKARLSVDQLETDMPQMADEAQVGRRILAARRELGDRLVRTYCVGKGIAVAFNPVPVADLFAAAFIDVGMVVHLSRVYDLPLSQKEAGSLVKVIVAESAALMGTVWALHFVSSALKIGTAGLSTIVTAGAQGAIAYYSTYIVGQVAAKYLGQGKSWGEGGPKHVVKQILNS